MSTDGPLWLAILVALAAIIAVTATLLIDRLDR
jgi:hypothetical protein